MSKGGPDLFVYSREQCHLCERMIQRLAEWHKRHAFRLTIIDIDQDPALQKKYAARVPLLATADAEICEYFLDEQALSRLFEVRGRP